MSQEQEQHYDQMEANEVILRQSELGSILADAYAAATNVDPRLADIAVVPIIDPATTSFAFARPAWGKSESTGKHEVHIRLDDLDATLALFKKSMTLAPKNNAIVAEILGIRPDEVTPQLTFVFSTLHEMGHTLEFMNYEDMGKTPEDYLRDYRVEKEKLPIGNLLASHLISDTHPNKQHVIENWESVRLTASRNYSNYVGKPVDISSMGELVDATSHMYRESKFEAHADQFAAIVFQTQPTMLTNLMGDITRYRTYPQYAGHGMAV